MSEQYILIDKTPVQVDDLIAWGRWFQEADEHRRVALTLITDDIRVSTVFLGIDHSWGGGPPLLFETMTFGGALDEEQERYSTYEEAEKGHEAMVQRVRAALAEAGEE